ncbi:MAG: M14-type cytosolic carboxypeptidase [bacterium]|nr:M14-type cytosolic carboxypeptidase [bacterium]
MRTLAFLALSMCGVCEGMFADGILVDNQIPGGNIEFVRAEGETIHLRNEMRDSEGWWFWWAFRVRGAAGCTRVFRFEKNRGWDENVSNRGACVSLDRGRTWTYTEREPFSPQQFTYTFPKDADEVWFAMSIPYGLREWEAFVGRHRGDPALHLGTLCASRHGRNVPLVRIGSPNAPYRVFLSSRHHCAETTATYVLEGVLEGALAQDALGDWFRRNVEIVSVPMMDLDGVVEGDQGKHRAPHDYNRDYTEFIWPETRAVRNLLMDGRTVDAFIDFHCPHYNDPRIHLMMCRAGRTEANQDAFAALVEKCAEGLVYRRKNNYPWGDMWNCDRLYATGISSTIWATRLPGVRFSGCYEIPFSDTRTDRTGPAGVPITPENCRAFGRSVAQSLREFLPNEAYGPVLPPPSAVGAELFSQKEVPADGGEWPVPAELARMESGFAVEFTLQAEGKPAPWTGVLQARFREKDKVHLPFSFGSDDRGRLYFRMDTHLSVNEQNVAQATTVFDGQPHRVRITFEPSAACANDTCVVCQIDGTEAFRVERRRGRVGFSSVFANTIAVGRSRSPFRGRVSDIRITKIR